MVIETLSIQVDVTPPGSKIADFVSYKSGGNNVTVFVPLTFSYTEAGTGFDFYVATQAVHLYADPGTVISLSTHTPSGSAGTKFLTVSGYLIEGIPGGLSIHLDRSRRWDNDFVRYCCFVRGQSATR